MDCFTVCLKRLPSARWARSILLIVFLLVAGGNSSLTGAAPLGPVDGHGLTPTDLDRVKVGDTAPDFTLEAETGTPVTLSQFRGKKPVILVFYRGHW